MYKIYLKVNFLGTIMDEVWKAPDERAKDCMLKSAKEYGFTVEKVVKVEA